METVPVSIPTIEENVVKRFRLVCWLYYSSAHQPHSPNKKASIAPTPSATSKPSPKAKACVTILSQPHRWHKRIRRPPFRTNARWLRRLFRTRTQVWSGGIKSTKAGARNPPRHRCGRRLFLKSPALNHAIPSPSRAKSRRKPPSRAVAAATPHHVGNPIPDFKFGLRWLPMRRWFRRLFREPETTWAAASRALKAGRPIQPRGGRDGSIFHEGRPVWLWSGRLKSPIRGRNHFQNIRRKRI